MIKGALKMGRKHIENIKKFNQNIIVTLNKFEDDSIEEIECVRKYVNNYNVFILFVFKFS